MAQIRPAAVWTLRLAVGLLLVSCAAASAAGVQPPYANVKDFGAKGDGIADDAPSVMSAIAAFSVPNNGLPSFLTQGAVLYFPNGVYRLASPIALPTGFTLLGQS